MCAFLKVPNDGVLAPRVHLVEFGSFEVPDVVKLILQDPGAMDAAVGGA